MFPHDCHMSISFRRLYKDYTDPMRYGPSEDDFFFFVKIHETDINVNVMMRCIDIHLS